MKTAEYVQIDVPERQLRIITAHGLLSFADLFETAQKIHNEQPPPRNLLWDLTDATLEELDSEQLREIIHRLKPMVERRQGGRSAVVTNAELDFGISRMLEAYSEMEGFTIMGRGFRTRQEAEAWLDEGL